VIPDFETVRLRVRDRSAGPSADRLRADLTALLVPEVLAPLPPGLAFQDGDSPAAWLDALERQAMVKLVVSQAGAVVGLLILADPDGDGRAAHLGYLFRPDVWGRGLATELIEGLIIAARGYTGLVTLYAGVAPGNPGSSRVLEKAGFARIGEDGETLSYRLDL